MEIFHGDGSKIDKLNDLLCEKAGFPSCYSISTQTYTRKVDLRVANAVAALGATAQRIASDIRHLAHEKEMEEPFEKDQIGSSAMAYKRNPMRCERICSFGRYLADKNKAANDTFAAQWMERTLDDSAIRRMYIPEMFLAADAICMTMDNVFSGLVIYPRVIHSHIMDELPFMATEVIIMRLVALGRSRQDAHEEIRVLSHQASAVVKQEGGKNDLIERIKNTEFFEPIKADLDNLLDPKNFVGRCGEQVERYCGAGGEVEKVLAPYKKQIDASQTVELTV
jgi:adenylosuccinate lyase